LFLNQTKRDGNLGKALGPYKIVDQSSSLLRLRRRSNVLPFLIVLVVISIIFRHELVSAPRMLWICWVAICLLTYPFYRWIKCSHPSDIFVQKDSLGLRYTKFLGGYNDVTYVLAQIKGIRPEVRSIGKGGRAAIVQVCLVNGKREDLYFANRQYNKSLLVECSSLLAETFSSIIGVPILHDYGSFNL
jgi:hypothetical protein